MTEKPADGVRHAERLLDQGFQGRPAEVFGGRFAVDRDRAVAGHDPNPWQSHFCACPCRSI
jgi:hypothetical protein